MDNAQLVGLSRQMALQRQMDVVANNLANINTTGFKAENILFTDYIDPVARDRQFSAPSDQRLNMTEDWGTVHDLSAGAVVQTGNALDVALNGDGFLVVQTPNGERWTRDGALQIGPDGTLVDLDGHPVLGDGGPIVFEPNETDVTITADGTVMTPAGAKGKLRIVGFESPQALTREGNNLYAGGTPQPSLTTRVVQGAIERSNVSGVSEMAEMIRVSRAYETLAGIMQRQDDLRRLGIQRLGDLSA